MDPLVLAVIGFAVVAGAIDGTRKRMFVQLAG